MIMDRESLSEQQDQQQPSEITPAVAHHQPPPPPQKCPRCDSSNTKFCYYNNYSLSQPRYFCKSCRRYWTQGGTLRNVPIGGGSRKSKRSKTSSSSSHEINARTQTLPPALPSHMISGQPLSPLPPAANSFYTGGAFLSPLAATTAANSRFGANMTLLQGTNLPSLAVLHREAPPPRLHQNEIFPSQRSSIPPRPPSSWTQSLIYASGGATPSAAGSSFWSCNNAADERDHQSGSSSFCPNEWSDHNHPGFHPPQ